MASKGRKGGLRLEVKPDKESKDVLHMLEWNWKTRFKKLVAQLVYRSAETSLKGLKAKLPVRPENRKYLESLSVAKITGLPDGEFGYAVQGQAKKARKQQLEPKRVIVYVRTRRSPKRVSPQVGVLVRYSPWTLDDLPFVPKKADATLVYRKVGSGTVKRVARARKRDKSSWKQMLARAGNEPKDTKNRFSAGSERIRAVSDDAFSALNLEFGQGGVKPKPHWRVAISGLKKRGLRIMMKDRKLAQSVSDPHFKGWMAWPKKTSKRISVRVAKTFVPFQKKLGIKTSK